MALSANSDRNSQGSGRVRKYPVYQSVTIYKGAGVMLNSTGYAVPAADTASCISVGIAVEKADNSSGSSAAIYVDVYQEGDFEFTFNGGDAAITDIGKIVSWEDDNTVDDQTATTNDVNCGVIVGWTSTTSVTVRVDAYSPPATTS